MPIIQAVALLFVVWYLLSVFGLLGVSMPRIS